MSRASLRPYSVCAYKLPYKSSCSRRLQPIRLFHSLHWPLIRPNYRRFEIHDQLLILEQVPFVSSRPILPLHYHPREDLALLISPAKLRTSSYSVVLRRQVATSLALCQRLRTSSIRMSALAGPRRSLHLSRTIDLCLIDIAFLGSHLAVFSRSMAANMAIMITYFHVTRHG